MADINVERKSRSWLPLILGLLLLAALLFFVLPRLGGDDDDATGTETTPSGETTTAP